MFVDAFPPCRTARAWQSGVLTCNNTCGGFSLGKPYDAFLGSKLNVAVEVLVPEFLSYLLIFSMLSLTPSIS
jgi:hypothetical protein